MFVIGFLYLASGEDVKDKKLHERYHLPYDQGYYYNPEIDGSVGPYQYNPVQFTNNYGDATSARPGSTAVASCQCEAYCRAMALKASDRAPLRL